MITGKPYDYLKFLAQIVLPALGALYFGLAGLWDLPAAEEVVGTIVLVDAFLGVLLGVSQVQYGKQVSGGTMVVQETPEGAMYQLELDEDPAALMDKREVRFDVQRGKAD